MKNPDTQCCLLPLTQKPELNASTGVTHTNGLHKQFSFSPSSHGCHVSFGLLFVSLLPAGDVHVSRLCELIPLSVLSFSAALLSNLNFRMCACFSLFGCILAASVHFPTLQSPSWEYVAALSRACFVVRTWACRRSKPGPEYISCCPPTQRLSVGPYLGRTGRSRFLVVKRDLSCAGKYRRGDVWLLHHQGSKWGRRSGMTFTQFAVCEQHVDTQIGPACQNRGVV